MIIRADVDRHMAELREWLAQTESVRLENMADFFRVRLDDYEEHMMIWREAYDVIETMLPQGIQTLLDLGCGTGLELDAVLPKRPDLRVTGIDLTQEMLDCLAKKHPQIETICADYFECDLGENRFDAALSFETLHHFTPEKKSDLFAKVYRALKHGGVYLQGEYVACCAEEEILLWDTLRRKRERDGVPADVFVHFDAPLTLERELALLRGAGFKRAHAPACINGACFLMAWKE